jgi:O-antigen/teichoic acid export membrane protein
MWRKGPATPRLVPTFVSLLSGETLTRGSVAVAGLVAVRALVPSAFGQLAYALAIAASVTTLADVGLTALVTRDVAADQARAHRIITGALALLAACYLPLLLLASVVALSGVLNATIAPAALVLAVVMAILAAGARPIEAALSGLGRAPVLVPIRALRATAVVAATVLVAQASHPTATGFLVAWTIAEGLGLAVAIGLGWHTHATPTRHDVRGSARAIARRSGPFLLLAATFFAYSRIDLLLLGPISGRDAVASYAVAQRVVETFGLVPLYLGGAFLATIAGRDPNAESVRQEAGTTLLRAIVAGVALSLVIAVAARPIVIAIAGHRYAHSAGLLRELSPLVALLSGYAVLANVQIARGAVGTLVRLLALSLALKLVFDAWAIPVFGAQGAAAVAVASEALLLAGQWRAAPDIRLPGIATLWRRTPVAIDSSGGGQPPAGA